MRARELVFVLSVAAVPVAQAQQWAVLPPAPLAGEPFVLQYLGFTGGSPAFVRSATVDVQGSTISYSVIPDDAGFSVPGTYRASTIVDGVSAGNYQVSVRLRDSFGIFVPQFLGTFSVAQAAAPATPQYRTLSGNWFAGDESGWGVNILQGDAGGLFAVWLTYLPVLGPSDGVQQNGMWLVMPGGRWLSPTQFRGILYQTAGPTVSRTFDATQMRATPVGYASLTFTGPADAQFEAQAGVGIYPYFSKTKAIHRLQF